MKKSVPALPGFPILALALSLAGCFGGEDDTATNSGNGIKDSTKKVEVSPGLYVGNYAPFDTLKRWESEFTLNADGSYRFFWIISNEPIGDIKGKWFIKDSALHFGSVTESYMNQNTGFFGAGASIEDDTNSIRDITDSSFTRKEWTLMRQKPYWVTYKKKSFAKLQAGSYLFSRDFPRDSASTTTLRIRITMEGADFLYNYMEDTTAAKTDTGVSFQAKAEWYQIGSIFGTEKNQGREFVDSLKAFGAWDTIPGALLQRVQSVSDTGFQIWSPTSSPAGSWDVYSKIR